MNSPVTPFSFLSLFFLSVEDVQPHLLTSGDLVPLRLCGVDLHGDGKRTDS